MMFIRNALVPAALMLALSGCGASDPTMQMANFGQSVAMEAKAELNDADQGSIAGHPDPSLRTPLPADDPEYGVLGAMLNQTELPGFAGGGKLRVSRLQLDAVTDPRPGRKPTDPTPVYFPYAFTAQVTVGQATGQIKGVCTKKLFRITDMSQVETGVPNSGLSPAGPQAIAAVEGNVEQFLNRFFDDHADTYEVQSIAVSQFKNPQGALAYAFSTKVTYRCDGNGGDEAVQGVYTPGNGGSSMRVTAFYESSNWVL